MDVLKDLADELLEAPEEELRGGAFELAGRLRGAIEARERPVGMVQGEILTVLIQTSRQNLEPGELAARITTRLKDKGII
jgi:hypothetical protein